MGDYTKRLIYLEKFKSGLDGLRTIEFSDFLVGFFRSRGGFILSYQVI